MKNNVIIYCLLVMIFCLICGFSVASEEQDSIKGLDQTAKSYAFLRSELDLYYKPQLRLFASGFMIFAFIGCLVGLSPATNTKPLETPKVIQSIERKGKK